VKQSSWLLGYTGRLEGVGTVNLGLQRARFRGTSRDGRTGVVTNSRDDLWLYNATLGIDLTPSLSLYVATQKGLEDSGTAPENAANRNEQLPPTRVTQVEGGVRWKFPGGQLVVNAFQITKPWFDLDAQNQFVRQGEVRHRGVETSLSGHFGKRFSLVAGAVLMQPRLTGGGRPPGTPSLYARVDANYRTDLLGGLTPLLTFTYTGKRTVNAALDLPGHAALDLGVRQALRIGKVPASFRFVVQDVFDDAPWKVVARNTLYQDERRRFTLTLAADF
jgi:iron complex outermembrane receptor protein